ncbi:MAG TPA: GH1 family beta-glucosidase [Anaerolineaceae bacterium]|nr:GH1 family beta-glucosidase [Anaerolineaceae bacterium]
MEEFKFPVGFVWGSATASYQIEGGWDEDGKGLSIWDMFCRKPKAIWSGHTGDTACDHYHLWKDDVALMKQMGIQAYRFSISWPRILPHGTGSVSLNGLDFYNRLVDELLENGIQPFVTLFHWDYPYDLYCRGGWLNPYSPDWFADYVSIVSDQLSDRVEHWMTLNEPQVFVGNGHYTGNHAPGLKLQRKDLLLIVHHALLAHGKGVQAIRAHAHGPVKMGFAPTGGVVFPKDNTPGEVEAARREMFSVGEVPYWSTAWYSDPIFLKQYPADGVKLFENDMPEIGPQDLDIISQPMDFYGVNIYGARPASPSAPFPPPGFPISAFYWPVVPESLYWGPKFIWERYHCPVYITENGIASMDWITLDGKIFDLQRIDYMMRYLAELQSACSQGVDVRGYFHWSLMDNFEWADGYRQRFGLVYVDFQDLKRTMKESAKYYQKVIAHNAVLLPSASEDLYGILH